MTVSLSWITPNAEELLVHIARVSNPSGQTQGHDPARLIRYLISHQHWSPFEMVSACFEITTTRDIGRQILRHRSFSFQEFSQRYADATQLPKAIYRKARLQDTKNRQNSLPTDDLALCTWWERRQQEVSDEISELYALALERGIAKEVARAVLPEGLTFSRLYMSGTMRSWLTYLMVRTDPSTQLEHRDIAVAIRDNLRAHVPATMDALEQEIERGKANSN